MKAFLVTIFVVVASAFVERAEWEAFKQKHAKSYVNPIEEFYRMKVYANNKAIVEKHMQGYAEGKHSYTLAINKFADFTSDEFSRLFNGVRVGSTRPHATHQNTGKAVPDSLDWRDFGAVTPVKNQGQCGSSWAMSVTGALEGAWALAGYPLVSLSDQQLMDCSRDYGNYGCSGGWIDPSFQYIHDNGGIQSEESYPYTASDYGSCKAHGKSVATLSSYVDIPAGSESDLLDAVANAGPVVVVIDATHYSFQMYSGGVLDDPSCTGEYANHPALAVGYGTEDGKDYWLVKNSWGTDWGADGYIKMRRNANNQCGIASSTSYPVV